MSRQVNIEEMVGATIIEVIRTPEHGYADTLSFITDKGTFFMYHSQDCCEEVFLEDTCGDLNDLIGSPIVFAEESTNRFTEERMWSCTHTFYKISTEHNDVTLRWLGRSNGYYSESVDLVFHPAE